MTEPLQIENISIDLLIPDPNNARLHDETNLVAIANSLRNFGQVKPIVITQDNKVLAGNGTLTAAHRLGWKTIDVVRTPADWSDADAMAYALADNRTAELAEWNADVLAKQLVDLNDAGWNINEIGFPTVPVADIDPETEKNPTDKTTKNPIITCPKCGHNWNRSARGSQE